MLNYPLCAATIITAFVVVVADVSAAPCQETQYGSSFRKNQPIVASDELIRVHGPVIPGGRVVCTVDFDLRSMQNVSDRIETGTLNGKKYRFYYSDGSGLVQGLPTSTVDISASYTDNWQLRCDIDAMTDKHWCSFSRADLTVSTAGDAGHSITVGYRHYPKSNIGLRVDKGAPVLAAAEQGFTPQQEAELMQQMLSGRTVLTRNVEETSPVNVDKTVALFGFPEATQIIDALNSAARPQN